MLPKEDPGLAIVASPSVVAVGKERQATADPLTHPKLLPPRVNWLTDFNMLPSRVRDARILGVGFDLAGSLHEPMDFDAAASQLNDHLLVQRENGRTRPIVFIGHVYGGIVIETALRKAEDGDATLKSILNHTAGLLLFSCPVLGLDLARDRFAKACNILPDARLFLELGTDSPTLRKLTDEFNSILVQKDSKKTSRSKMVPESNSPTQRERQGEVDEATDQTGFLIVRFVTLEEYKAESKMPDGKLGKPKLDRVIDRLDDPDNILVQSGRLPI